MNRGDAPDRVRENYRRFCAAIGADMGNIVCASQVHGDTVRTVTAADLGIGLDEPEPWQADGLVTDIPGVTLAVYSADCLPILLYDPVRRVVGRSTPAGGAPPWASPPRRWSAWWTATAATGWTSWPPSAPASPSAASRPTRTCPTP
ncbi:laccase domain-containing protein [Flavonifractor plautii]|nr:laccase domain-containing protein [Flavonifractor plautii]